MADKVLWCERPYKIIERIHNGPDKMSWVLLEPEDSDLRTSWVPLRETKPVGEDEGK